MKNKIKTIAAIAALLTTSSSVALAFDDPFAEPVLKTPADSVETLHSSAEPVAENPSGFLPDVENLSAENEDGFVSLSWGAVDGADSYTIYFDQAGYDKNGGIYGNETKIISSDFDILDSRVIYNIEDLEGGQKYYFSVAAEDSTGAQNGSLNYSEEVSLKISEGVEKNSAPVEEEGIVEEEQIVETAEEEVASDENLIEEIEFEEVVVVDETSGKEEEKELPKSGPFAGFAVAAAAAGAYVIRRRKSQK